ncbi:glycosyltransferase family 4 protein [Brunnivagina elsteri]|uniref:glycosyltransferase family 4 protein n=1 Tax=Brunnivagina elsteri TaxID=1247191 RepID=UPI003183A01E
MAHNYYQQTGGEEQVFLAECNLLENYGHQVYRYILNNDQIETTPPLELLGKTIWNRDVYREMRSLIQQHHIQIVHFHNTFPLISPAAYYAAKAEGAGVVQTFHNYRLLCPNALFLRDGKICEDCLGKAIPWQGIEHNCYRGSKSASAAVVTMLTTHRLLQTWNRQVDAYIALTDFARDKFIQGGLSPEKVFVKPNFVDLDPGVGEGKGGYALFVGRLSVEKGIDVLLDAWAQIGTKIPLKILGDGLLASEVSKATKNLPGIEWLGRRPMDDVYALMQNAQFLIFPSKWYEGLPRTLIESFACGTPVIAANLGAMSSFVTPYETGLHFQPGNSDDLVTQVEWAIAHPELLSNMRHKARTDFEVKYTPENNYWQMLDIYRLAIGERSI